MRGHSSRLHSGILAVQFCFLGLTTIPALAEEVSTQVYKIEEDWELCVTEPDANNFSPQVNLFMAADADNDSTYFQLQLNYAAQDDFSGGGFRVAALSAEKVVDEARSSTRGALNQTSDTVVWTNVLAVINSELLFAVKNGYCNAWGSFGGPDYLIRMPAGSITDLSQYKYLESSDTAEISFGKNRVSGLRLKRVRLYALNGTYTTIELSGQ